jgi:xanthine dehydrogenase accessory factor
LNKSEWITHASRLQQADTAFALVTVLSAQAPTSGKSGDKAVVTPDGQIHGWIGGGCAQPAVIKTVRQAIEDGIPRKIRISPADENQERDLGDVLEFGMSCHSGGTLELFIDPVLPQTSLCVVGDSPVARALANLAPRVGLGLSVVAQGANVHDFSEAQTILTSDSIESVQAQLPVPTFVVVATQGRRDLQGLKAALAMQPKVIWFVSSAKKASVLMQNLLTSGEDPTRVAQIIAPAGVSIGALTPEEIALSVLTSIVAARRGRLPAPTVSTPKTTQSSCCTGQSQHQQAMASEHVAAEIAQVEVARAQIAPVASQVSLAQASKSSCCGG